MKTLSKKASCLGVALFFILSITSTCLFPAKSNALSGGEFRAGRIIDDAFFTNKNAISVDGIQSLLNDLLASDTRRDGITGVCDTNGLKTVYDKVYGDTVTRSTYGSRRSNPTPFTCLNNYYENPDTKASNYGGKPIPDGAKSAAQLIYDAGQAYNINPQVLLVTLQKEQGLATDDWPFQKQFQYAMGAHCPDSGPNGTANCDPAYAGFGIQMKESARLFRYYLDNMSQPWWTYKKLGSNTIQYSTNGACGSGNVNIESAATAALYTYTPYQPNPAALADVYGDGDSCSSFGNRNFWRMFNEWFGSGIGCPTIIDNTVYRLHRIADNNYLLSSNSAEICFAVLYYGYVIDGPAMSGVAATDTDARSLFRLSRNGQYLYTTNPNERDDAMSKYGYTYEGVVYYVRSTPADGFYPVYRLSKNGHYVLTVSATERDSFTASGYAYEGVVFYAKSDSAKTPVYRLSKNGLHIYTPSAVERDLAVSLNGYSYEGIGFYVQTGMTGDTTTAYRLERSSRRLYTTNLSEKLTAMVGNYRQENNSFFAYAPNYAGTVPVYRLVNKSTGDYLFTTIPAERDQAVNNYGYTYEGVGFDASP